VIEATEPVAYVTTRPDPLTLLLEFRNVASDGVTNTVSANAKSPVAGVSVEPSDSLGVPAARVRVALAQPVGHRVHSDRNTIVVDFDKPSPAPYVRAAARGFDQPDAMLALRAAEMPTSDPIAELGLATPTRTAVAPPPPAARPATQFAQKAGSTTVRPVQAQQPPPSDVQPTQPGTPRRYTGHPVSLDFQGADLRAVLRTFSEISGLNIVIDPAVQGTVDVALRDVPWDQALDIILAANKLGYIVDGTIVRIAPLNVLADEQVQRRKVAEEQALAGELSVLTRTLSYAKAEELASLVTKSALSQRGTVQVDQRTNTLIITDLAPRLTTASDLIATLDQPPTQVEIEARIVQANKSFERRLGVQWGFNGRVDPALGNTTNMAFPNSATIGGRTGGVQGPVPGTATAGPQPTAANFGVGGATSAVGLTLGSINGAFNLDLALTALESTGNGRILSTPRVMTQNNVAAEVTQGTQIPIQTVANNTVTVTFKDAALTLKVTPQITAAGTVIMTISLENSQADFTRAVNGIPPINTQRANTSVLVSDGQTTVIGGVYVTNEQAQTDRTPGLGNIPLLKWLFKRDANTSADQELLIFITPRIIKA
jgi:type IV pilus assembly protein PilQ